MVERVNPELPISQQCRLLAVSRSSLYRRPAELSAEDLAIMALIDRQYLARPYYWRIAGDGIMRCRGSPVLSRGGVSGWQPAAKVSMMIMRPPQQQRKRRFCTTGVVAQ